MSNETAEWKCWVAYGLRAVGIGSIVLATVVFVGMLGYMIYDTRGVFLLAFIALAGLTAVLVAVSLWVEKTVDACRRQHGRIAQSGVVGE